MTFEKLIAGIQPIDEKKRQAAMERCDQLVKPLGSLGKLESIACRLAGIYGEVCPEIKGKAVIVMAADNGVLDTGSYGDLLDRSWVFRTVGYGSDTALWKDMMSTLRMIGYEGSVSIEHEDGLMSVKQGLEKAIRFLQDVMITEQPAQMWWA